MTRGSKGRHTRDLIIDKAVLLFTRNGYNHTSLKDILAVTDLTKGGFYFHFGSKEELGAAVIERLRKYWRAELLPAISRGKDAGEKLQILLSTHGDCDNDPDCIRPTILLLNLATEMIEVHDPFTERIKQIFSVWWNTLNDIIDEGKGVGLFRENVDTRATAGIILSNIMGANLLALLNRDPAIYEHQMEVFKQILFAGLARDGGHALAGEQRDDWTENKAEKRFR